MKDVTLEGIQSARQGIDPCFLSTPQYFSEGLREVVGANVLCKIESSNPIGCFKGRGIDWWVKRRSGADHYVCASAGNLGQAMAFSGRKANRAVHVFVAETANQRKVDAIRRLGATVYQVGRDFDESKEHAARFAMEHDWPLLIDGRDPEIAEGCGTIGLELVEQESELNLVFLPLGNGALVNGVGRALRALSPKTLVVGVCALGAPCMAQSWKERRVIVTETATTIADGIAVRAPVPEAVDSLRGIMDDVVVVTDNEIIRAMKIWYSSERQIAEPSGAAALAAALKYECKPHQVISVVLTGSNISDEHESLLFEARKVL